MLLNIQVFRVVLLPVDTESKQRRLQSSILLRARQFLIILKKNGRLRDISLTGKFVQYFCPSSAKIGTGRQGLVQNSQVYI